MRTRLKIDSINLKIHGPLWFLLASTAFVSGVAVDMAFDQHNDERKREQAHRERIDRIEKQANVTQAFIDNNIPLYDGVNITNYVCNPDQPPEFDWGYYVEQIHAGHKTQTLLVSDASKPARIIGTIDERGFNFEPWRCQR